MSSLRHHSGLRVAHANREQYIRLLQESLPSLGAQRVRQGRLPLQPRTELAAAVDAGELALPAAWVPTATRALRLACADVVPREAVDRSDLFLCALIHPSFIATPSGNDGAAAVHRRRCAATRRAVAMPLETTLSGTTVLRLLRELRGAHEAAIALRELRSGPPPSSSGASPAGAAPTGSGGAPRPLSHEMVLTPEALPPEVSSEHLLRVPRAAGLDRLVLFDPAYFPETRAGETVPAEVLLSSVTSLCGAIHLCEGSYAVANFLDRMLARVANAP